MVRFCILVGGSQTRRNSELRKERTPLILHEKKQKIQSSSSNIWALHKKPLIWAALFGEVQVVVQPLSGLDLLNAQTRLTICQRSKVQETPDDDGKNTARGSPHAEQVGLDGSLANRLVLLHGSLLVLCKGGVARGDVVDVDRIDVEDEFDEGASHEGGSEVGGQVVVKEELTTHDVEGNVVGGPGEEEETGRVVETVAST
jgi:hypothetical protein